MDPQSTAAGAPNFIGLSKVVQREEEMLFMLDFIEKSDQMRQKFVPIWDEILENYMVAPAGGHRNMIPRLGSPLFASPGLVDGNYRTRSLLKDPETHQIIESLSSQGLNLLLNGNNYITCIPTSGANYGKAQLLAKLLMALLLRPGVWRTNYEIIKNAFSFGIAYVEIGWETRMRQQVVAVPRINSLGQQDGQTLEIQEVLYRDRPLYRAIDHYNAYPDPSGTRIQEDMLGFVKRFDITENETLRLARNGTEGNPSTYDLEQARSAIGRNSSKSKKGDAIGGPRRFPWMPNDAPDQYGRMTGFEGYFTDVPYKPADGVRNRVITLVNGEVVRSRPNPYLDGNIPVKEIVINPIIGRHYGLSPAEVNRFLQDSLDDLLMQFTDAADLAVRGPLLVGRAFSGDLERLRERRLGDIIECADPKAVLPIPVDLNVLQFAALEIMRRKMTMREASGATNPIQNIASPGDKTATEISTIAHFASQRVEPMIQLVERDDFPWIGRTLHSRLRQFVPDGGAIAALAGEMFEIPFEAIDVDADVIFTGSRGGQSQVQIISAIREAINVLETSQGALILYPELFEEYFEQLHVPGGKDVVKRALERLAIRLKAQAAASQGAGGEPSGMPGATPASQPSASGKETFGTQAGQTEQQGQALA